MDIEQERMELLTSAVEQRRRQVMHYQVDIDNFTAAIAEIEAAHFDNPALTAFAEQLRGLLKSSAKEQAKERIMLTVIERQLEATLADNSPTISTKENTNV